MTLRRVAMRRRSRPTGFSKSTRAIVLDRDGWACVPRITCDGAVTMKLTVHHRRNRGMGGSTDPSTNGPANGLACCFGCNGAMEDSPSAALCARESGWKVGAGVDPASVPVLYADGLWWLLRADGTRRPMEAAA